MELLDYRNWTGTRGDLQLVIQAFEAEEPTRYGLISKTTGKLLPIKPRRIQQFIDMGILPKPKPFRSISGDQKQGYDFEHICRYIAAITLRKRKFTLEQAADHLMKLDTPDVVEIALGSIKDVFGLSIGEQKGKMKRGRFDSQELRRLGRVEGRALKSEQILLAITPWCHAYVSKRRLAELNYNDVSVLVQAFENSLLSELEK